MPSLRKVVEDVEYNTLPSPTTRGFSSATAARANKKLTTATSDGGGASGANTSHESRGDAESKTGKEAGVGNKKQSMKTNGGSKKEVIEIQSDEEDVTLSDLAKIKESSPSKTVVCSGRPLGKSTMQVRGATNNSAHVQNGATAKTGTFQGTVGKKDHPVSESSGKTGGVNNRSNASETSTKSITNQTSKASSSKSSAIQPSTTRPPVKFTAKNDNLSIAAPQTHHPYSANPTVLRNTNAIIQNIHMNLQNTMPMTQPPVIPGMEKWSEYRIDSAATVGELEAIRRRLLTLTNRVDLRIKEMNFLKAIGMTEWKGDNKRETTSEVIRKIIESGVSNGSKSGDNTLKRKRSQDSIDEKVESSNPEECSVCCPFCLSTNTSIGTNCSICDEKSNICLLCRGYCVKCKRLTCEDCLLRCDSCSSDTYCSDCMPRSGKCQKCNSSKPNMNIPQTAGATSQRTVSTAYQARQTNIAGIEAPPNRPIATGNMTTQPQVIHTPPDYSIHRFVVGMEEKGTLGLLVGERMNGVIVQKVYKKGHAEMIGVKQNDEICFPFTGALALNSYDKFLYGARSRPMIFEVRRKFSRPANKILHRFHITEKGPLGMTVKQVAMGDQLATLIATVQSNKLASLYGLCAGDIICKPEENGKLVDDVYGWFMEGLKNRPFIFDVWRSPSSRPYTNPECIKLPTVKSTNNPFVWTIGD